MVDEFDGLGKAFGGGGLAAVVVWGLSKMMTSWKQDAASQAGASATVSQFKALQEQIEACQRDAIEFRAQFNIMDKKIHVQQRTITRMEMLLRQFSSLVQDKGIDVPEFMSAELGALIDSDTERNKVERTQNERKEDKDK
jgi:hypothetical protein